MLAVMASLRERLRAGAATRTRPPGIASRSSPGDAGECTRTGRLFRSALYCSGTIVRPYAGGRGVNEKRRFQKILLDSFDYAHDMAVGVSATGNSRGFQSVPATPP